MTLHVAAAGLSEVGPEWDALFAAGPGFQSSPAWFEATVEAALPPGSRAVFLLCCSGGRPVAMLPLLHALGGGRTGCRRCTPACSNHSWRRGPVIPT